MEEGLETITITFEDGENVDFYVLEETQLMGINYYLVVETEEYDSKDDVECAILKENMDASDEEFGSYSFVDDEKELESLSKIFDELLGEDDDDDSITLLV
ncbi:MAG: DUF1292 domain-containing protein [Lachnospiraceae bacterium]|nr:DUF1292 domain-containing protein [Lachnospiraceae bacterium]